MRQFLLALGLSVFAVGCQGSGFKSADDLESQQRGPKACAASCEQMGLEMAAFVLFEKDHSGCVCAPKDGSEEPEHPFADSLPPAEETAAPAPAAKPAAEEPAAEEPAAEEPAGDDAAAPAEDAASEPEARQRAIYLGAAQLAALEGRREADSDRRKKSAYYGWQP